MYKHLIRFIVLLAVCSLAIAAGASAQKGRAKVDVSKITKALDKDNDPTKCKGPRPPQRGCSIFCKPCFVSVCESGKWKYERIELLEEDCKAHEPYEAGACVVPFGEPCPIDCKKCIKH
jgi:hypothetical protein